MRTENIIISADYKLRAIAQKSYAYQKWTPKVGDYFTIIRYDDEIFKVVDINETHFFYVLCNGLPQEPDDWDLELSEFGEHFCHVPDWIMNEILKN